jgi:hypothetical protein
MLCSSPYASPANHTSVVARITVRNTAWQAAFKAARACLLAFAGLLLAHAAIAQTTGDTTNPAPQQASPGNNGIVPHYSAVGSGRLRFFGLHVYDAQLWAGPSVAVTTDNYDSTALALTLTYGRTLYGKAIAERSLKEMQGVATVSDTQAQQWLATMLRLFPDVNEDDQLTGVYTPNQGAAFWLNGRLLGQVPDPAFARAFFGIWLDARSSEPALRAQLLTRQ